MIIIINVSSSINMCIATIISIIIIVITMIIIIIIIVIIIIIIVIIIISSNSSIISPSLHVFVALPSLAVSASSPLLHRAVSRRRTLTHTKFGSRDSTAQDLHRGWV